MTQQLLEREVHEPGETWHATADPGLARCGACGHSRRNHEGGRALCARALCDCARYR